VVGVTTVALLDRKVEISRDLFTRYWRDVHGVMAARIPGFDSYTQYHVTPVAQAGSEGCPTFEGIAVVTFRNETDRDGLIHSEVTRHIHRDEQNVFRGALLYSLPPGASTTHHGILGRSIKGSGYFFLVPADNPHLDQVLRALHSPSLSGIECHDLTGGDPAAWNDTDVATLVADRHFATLIRAEWTDEAEARAAAQAAMRASGGRLFAFKVDAAFVMVNDGRPTPIGLRGLDAVRTIEEAKAANQLDRVVEEALYGRIGLA
jgi:hypothetical protein